MAHILVIGSIKMYDLSKTVMRLQEEQELSWRPHTEILFLMCICFSILFGIILIGLILLICEPEMLKQLAPLYAFSHVAQCRPRLPGEALRAAK